MSHKMLYTCEGCDTTVETKPNGYPSGWGRIHLEASGFIPYCRPADIEGTHDLCAVCQNRLLHAMKVTYWDRPKPKCGETRHGE